MLCEDELSRKSGNQYELVAREYLESIGVRFIDSNIVGNGGEVDLLMQSAVTIDDVLMVGEVCIVEVKGRAMKSDWNAEVVSPAKARRWRLAAQHVFWRLEDGEWSIPHPVSGVQLVLVRIENQLVEVNWHAIDLDLG